MPKRQAYQKVATYEAQKGEVKKIVLLYSGSMYTSALIPWLKHSYKADVIALIVDIGQKKDLEDFKSLALKLGASKAIIVDAKEQFAKEYIAKAIRANAAYQGKYHMVSPLSRPLLAKIAVEIAEAEGASAISHGCSAQSNDQIRIEGTILALNPDMKLIAPLRDETLFKADAVKMAREYKIPQEYQDTGYSYDDNVWGVSIIGGNIEDTHIPSRIEHILKLSVLPEKAPEIAERITIDFEKGIPVRLNDTEMNLVELITKLNTIGGKHGIGLSYTIEDMILGLKSRSIDEEPAATILIDAHKELEKYVSSREENEYKTQVDTKWTYLCYEGKWYEPLIKDVEAFINSVNQKVTGKVYMRLYKGTAEIISIHTPKAIFEKKLNQFANTGIINHRAIAGFIELTSIPMQIANRAEKSLFLSIGKRSNKFKLLPELRELRKNKYRLYATYKTYKFLKAQDIDAILVHKLHQPHLKPNLADLLEQKRFDLIIRIPSTKSKSMKEKEDSQYILDKAKEFDIPMITDIKEAKQILLSLDHSKQ